uniref:Cytoskeletal-regulatory complex EF hand/EF-hand domain pair, putative n=1 Tax=Theileria annulata TaxID=5874 RepID=A0A3B0MSM2_THEAN
MSTRINLSHEENDFYSSLFVQCDTDGYGYASGDTVSFLLRKSDLDEDLLYSIWEIADKNKTGQLDFSGFCICMRLIAHVQQYGPQALHDPTILNEVPEHLPIFAFPEQINPMENFNTQFQFNNHENQFGNTDDLKNENGFNKNRAEEHVESDPFTISSSDFEGYKYSFIQLTNSLDGYLLGDEARAFYLSTTNLGLDDLMHLWNLADFDKDGRLTLREFCVMQKLCESVNIFETLPKLLPDPLFEFLQSDNFPDYASVAQTPPDTTLPVDVTVPTVQSNVPTLPPQIANTVNKKSVMTMGEKGIRSDPFAPNELDHPQVSTTYITNDLILQCENLLKTLRDAINSEKNSILATNNESIEIETKLKSDTKTLENLMAEYRTIVGDSQNMSKRRSLLNSKLSIVNDQIQEIRNQIQSIRVSSVALSSSIDKNNEEQSLLQNARQMFLKQLEEDTNLLKIEERELAEISNHLQQLKRQRDLLKEKNNQLKECLSQSENATKTMLRSIQHQQGKIMAVRNERINLLEERLKMTNEINSLNQQDANPNDSLGLADNSSSSEASRNFTVNRNVNLDKKGIRVSSSSLKVGDEFPK